MTVTKSLNSRLRAIALALRGDAALWSSRVGNSLPYRNYHKVTQPVTYDFIIRSRS